MVLRQSFQIAANIKLLFNKIVIKYNHFRHTCEIFRRGPSKPKLSCPAYEGGSVIMLTFRLVSSLAGCSVDTEEIGGVSELSVEAMSKLRDKMIRNVLKYFI